MGAWGTDVFSDDLAQDIRREYNILLSIGKDNSEVEEMLINYYSSILNCKDPDEDIFWYALALSEWKQGRLSDFVKSQALGALANGRDLERWKVAGNEKNYVKRKKVLQKFRAVILEPMPPAKKIRKPAVHHCPWREGDLLAYRIVSNKKALSTHPCFMKYVLLRVVKIEKHPVSQLFETGYYNETMLVALYNWMGGIIPDSDIVNKLNYIPIMDESAIVLPKELHLLYKPSIEWFAWLNWLPTKVAVGDVTVLDCDRNYQRAIPTAIEQPYNSRVLTHFLPFDVTLSKRFELYWENKSGFDHVFI